MRLLSKFITPRAVVRPFPPEGESFLSEFLLDGPLTTKSYEKLFLYFIEGFETYRSQYGASANYPGLPSKHGKLIDQMEGFSRIVPLIGAWVRSGRPAQVRLTSGRVVDLVATFLRGLTAGTDPSSPAYWGEIRQLDQRIVESCDLALSLWLLRDHVWGQLALAERRRVINWLKQVFDREVRDNNWHLFVPFVGLVLEKLGFSGERSLMRQHYERFKEFYRGEGWFSDGPGEVFDFYNAWGIHYLLYWYHEVDPTWDTEFITSAQRQFLTTYKYLLGPCGVPILGRSICYRMALPAPLIFGHSTHPDQVTAGEAKRSLDIIWRYFIRHGAVALGSVTQGYCGADPRILDNYSGPASCLWSLRSLVAAFYYPEDSTLWCASGEPLPVEKGDYSIIISASGWRVQGKKNGNVIEVEKINSVGASERPLKGYGTFRKSMELILRRPLRPANRHVKYERRVYSSGRPFCGC
jgi:hypothetical protein